MEAAPPLRQDLQVTPLQDAEGVIYYDVRDPHTGGALRLYDFEWLVASRCDGRMTFAELARFTQEQLGYDATPEELQVYVQRLQQLGLLGGAPAEPAPSPSAEVAPALPPPPVTTAAEPGPEEVPLERRATLLLSPVSTAPASPVELPSDPAAGPVPAEAAVPRITLPPAAAAPVAPAESVSADEGEYAATVPDLPAMAAAPTGSAAAEQAPAAAVEVRSEAPEQEKEPTGELPQAEKTARPVEADEEFDQIEGQSRAGKWIAVLVIVLAVVVIIYFLMGLQGPALGVRVLRVQPHAVVRSLSAPAVVHRGEAQVLKLEAGGLLSSVVSEGAEVSAGMVLAVLQEHARREKEITELKERIIYYQRRRDAARDRGDAALEREAQIKIRDKEQRLALAEAELKKTQLVADRAGKVKKVLVSAGEMITPGSDVLELADRAPGAELRLPAEEAQGIKIGQELQLAAATPLSAHVTALTQQGGATTIHLELPDAAAVEEGQKLQVLRGRVQNVIEVPSTALQGDTVFVVNQGRAARRRIKVLEKEGANVLVEGLGGGDQVIVSNLDDLRDGQAVKAL